MGDLRKHLQAERAAHRAEKYPGDLSLDILGAPTARIVEYASRNTPRQMSRWKIIAAFSTISGIAALLAIVLLIRPASSPRIIVMQPVPPEEQTRFVLDEKPSMPDDVPIVPTYQAMTFPSVPNFWDSSSSDDDSNNQSSNTTSRESV